MELTTSPPESWTDFAETFFVVDEDRRRQSFLARNTIPLLEANEVPVIQARIAQSAIPEIADACLIVLHSANGDWEEAVVAHRYEEEEIGFQALRQMPPALTDALFATSAIRTLSPFELSALARHVPDLMTAVAMPFGPTEAPAGYAFFFQTRSNRSFPPNSVRLIRDLIDQGQYVILHAQATAALRHEICSREKFISIASHELKTPLTALKLQLESLRRSFQTEGPAPSPERIDKSFKGLERSIQRLHQSIDMLFSLSEIRSGKVGLIKEPADFAQLVRDVVSRMETLMHVAGCTIEVKTPEELPAFFDTRRLEQALINLLANAAKYAPGSKVEVVATGEGDRAKIEIRDDGPGIPAKDHERIFEAFSRGGGAAAVEGLGLGLFVTQGVIRAHGGTLSLVSSPGRGACFVIEVPRWQA